MLTDYQVSMVLSTPVLTKAVINDILETDDANTLKLFVWMNTKYKPHQRPGRRLQTLTTMGLV